jgi:anti-sigma factor RsiW
MMRHISAEDLVSFASGGLSDERRQEVAAHLGVCDACRRSQDELTAVRDLLGEWKVNVGTRDSWPAIEQRLDSGMPAILSPGWRRVGRILRIAAVLAIGVGLGHLVGRLAWPSDLPMVVASLDATEQEATEELGLHAIEWPASAGLFPTVLDLTNAPEGGEARP